MNSERFETYLKEQILPNLPDNTVFVIDNASYHCRTVHKAPSMSATIEK